MNLEIRKTAFTRWTRRSLCALSGLRLRSDPSRPTSSHCAFGLIIRITITNADGMVLDSVMLSTADETNAIAYLYG